MNWSILDDYTVRRYEPKGEKAILIRILEPRYKSKGEPYEIHTIDKYSNVLKLYFDDIKEVPPEKHKNRFSPFSKEDCLKLIEFISKNRFDEVVVHCNAGISRSSAIMICISRLLNLAEIEEKVYKCGRFNPNKLVLNIYEELNPSCISLYENSKTYNVNEDIWMEEELDVIID